MNDVFIYQIARVPNAKKHGRYKTIPAESLVTHLLNKVNCELSSGRGEVQLSHSIGMMGNPARYALLNSKIEDTITASTIDSQCGGTYKAIESAFTSIKSGQRSWFIAGGMESSSLQSQRNYHKNDPRFTESEDQIDTAHFAPYETLTLNESAEKMALDFQISKEDMLHWTERSHLLANQSKETFIQTGSIIPFNGLEQDQGIKDNLTFDKLLGLTSDDLIDRTTACSFFDGAGIVVMGGSSFGVSNKLKPRAKIEAIEFVAFDPNESPKGCIFATESLLKRMNMQLDDIDFYEVCESYAVKPLAYSKHFGISKNKINSLGSNLAMGHPFAASGVLNTINLLGAMERNDGKMGIVSAGIAGGLGAAILISRE